MLLAPCLLLLATAEPSASELASFLRVSFYLIGLVAAVFVIWRQARPQTIAPQPLAVVAHDKVATAEQLKEVHGRIKREREEINGQLAAHTAELREIRDKLDDDIADLHTRIDRVPDRVIALLRETKGLL